ncbi:TonB-dependent receptor plug [Granulicella mallensis MP5ACTX8]|uniref:TonB-dependent receptor plug n=1 Tax=Granulicella mallensis (strain ATCC BAA-1857 / DSM 23137 / MP5ACTX8) TaxID=682795 RepID=G8NQT5_GRAMM|nr:TonB-dependent receptor plug [Granulicella mallensis MP5ACTX8]
MIKASSAFCTEVAFVPNVSAKRASFTKKRPYLLLLLMTILFLFSPLTRGQELAGTFSGTVTDSTGAVIQNANITITQNGVNGEPRIVQSNSSGNYTASNLPAGTYTITVTDPNFETFADRNVVLNVAQKRTINVQLKPGSQSQTVTVEDHPVSVDTESSSQAGTISGTQVRELELVNRNFQQLVTLQPGVVNQLPDQPGFGSLNSTSTISVNGARTGANNWSVDGADINDSGSNTTLLNTPSIDAIQEFTLERSSYDASFGRSGGGQVLVSTRSGTSSFHGDVYEFVRTENTNANSYFNNLTGLPRSPDHYNNYGFTLGGPLYIPHVYNTGKNKTFFFWSEEWRKISTPTTNNVPGATAAELSGTFFSPTALNAPAGCVTSYTPYIAPTAQGGVGSGGVGTININNPNCISKNAQVYLSQIISKFPANFTTVNAQTGFAEGSNITSYTVLNNFRQDLVRIDHYFSDRLHFFARGMEDSAPSNSPTGLFGGANYPGVLNVPINAPGYNVVGNLTWTISPKMVNELEFAYSQGGIKGGLNGAGNSPSVLASLTNQQAYPDPYGRIPGVTLLDSSVTGVSQGNAPYNERNLDRNIFDNFTVTLGNHTLHAGVTVQQMLKTENGGGGNPNFQFNTWGDFLLGNVALYTQGSRDIVPDLQFWNTEAYIQDDWKATHNLNVNLGLRWTRFPSPGDVNDTLTNFDPTVYDPKKAPLLDGNGNFVAGQAFTSANYANGMIFPTGSACAAAQAITSQASCSPYGGIVNPNNNWNFAPRVGFAYDLYGNGKTVLRGGFGIFFDRTLDGIWEQNAFSDPPLVQTTTISNTSFDNPLGTGAAVPALGPNALTTTGDPTFKVPSYTDYNLSLQQQLAPTTVLEIAYVGSVSRHLLGELDLNMPTLATREENPLAPLNNIRPYLGYSDFHTRLPVFTSNYNSLQVQLTHKSRDLNLGIAYTWSKNLSDQANDRGTANTYTYDPKLDYGPSSINEPQIFIANFVYKEPFLREQHGLLGHVLGGWEISGITNFQSGLSTTLSQNTDPFACTPPGNNNPAGTATPLCAATNAGGPYPGGLGMVNPNADILPRPDQIAPVHLTKTKAQWFTTSSFIPAEGHFGTAPVGGFLSPGLEKIDLGLLKNFKITQRANLQMRAETFNVFNHTNFSTLDTGIADGTFGQATAAHSPRIMQFSGKLYF